MHTNKIGASVPAFYRAFAECHEAAGNWKAAAKVYDAAMAVGDDALTQQMQALKR